MSFPDTIGRYKFIKEIGSGGFSLVALVQNVKTQQYCAAKMINRKIAAENNMLYKVESELRIHEIVSHDGIAKILDVIYTQTDIFIFMEFGENGTLYDYIVNYGPLSEQEALDFFTEIIASIDYLHSRGIAHRDLKLDNIVLTKSLKPKLIDFGFAFQNRFFDTLRQTVCGTLEYMSPEIITAKEYDPLASDIWSIGVCLYIMVFSAYPWNGSDLKISQRIIHGELVFPKTVRPLTAKLLKGMLQKNPQKRMNAKEINELIHKKMIKETHSYKSSFSITKRIHKPYVAPAMSFRNMKIGATKDIQIRNTISQPL